LKKLICAPFRIEFGMVCRVRLYPLEPGIDGLYHSTGQDNFPKYNPQQSVAMKTARGMHLENEASKASFGGKDKPSLI
jgi:hypothetical protein